MEIEGELDRDHRRSPLPRNGRYAPKGRCHVPYVTHLDGSLSPLSVRLLLKAREFESGTFWERLRRERHGVQCPAEAGIPAVKVAGELVIEDAGADLEQ
jgi:hypothetical protein